MKKVWFAALCVCLTLAVSVTADDAGIHRMMIRGRILELLDTVQLTSLQNGKATGAWISPDGKYVAYLTEDPLERLWVVSTSGGRSSVLLGSGKDLEEEAVRLGESWVPDIQHGLGIAWSPDSRLIAVLARHSVSTRTDVSLSRPQKSVTEESCILVMSPSGLRRGTFNIPTGSSLSHDIYGREPIQWSPDSRRFAVAFSTWARDAENYNIVAFNWLRGSSQSVVPAGNVRLSVYSWSGDGKAVRYVKYLSRHAIELRQVGLDGKDDTLIEDHYDGSGKISPDRAFEVMDGPGVHVKNRTTGRIIEVFKDFVDGKPTWTHDGKMLVFSRSVPVKDVTARRTRTLLSIWLAAPEAQALNHMCVALDLDLVPGGFSRDHLSMAYVYQGHVCLAQLGWKDAKVADKVFAGVFDEEAEKQTLLNNAKQIGAAMQMYASDWDSCKMPAVERLDMLLEPYTHSEEVFNRPGTEQLAFQYFPRADVDLCNLQPASAQTIIGKFDVGYGWQVMLYADGHSAVVPKK